MVLEGSISKKNGLPSSKAIEWSWLSKDFKIPAKTAAAKDFPVS